MKPRLPLGSKVLCLAFLNLCLLALAILLIVRAQFRLDPGSFLLAPAQNRIINAAHSLALDLDGTPEDQWAPIFSRYSETYRATFLLFDESGERLAGPDLTLPPQVAARLPRRERPPRDRPPRPDQDPPPDDRPPGPDRPNALAPPLFLTVTSSPTRYWAGIRIPLRTDPAHDPHPGVLILTSPSLLASGLFFDVTPWLTIGLAVIVISVACWLPFIRGLTNSISELTDAAGRIAEGQFQFHAADKRRDELGQLGDAVNRISTRLEAFVSGQKTFLSGIAHELSNPIATIQFGLGNLERRLTEDQRSIVADIQEEVQHMSALVNELLSFSHAGMQGLDVKLTLVNVAATVVRAVARECSPTVSIEVAVAANLNVRADAEYLYRAISNLLRNAIRYAGHAGPIRVSAQSVDGTVSIAVADQGPGVPEEHLEHIFAPFYRLDPARSHDTGGLGLGLAIVRGCIEACQGSVRCRKRQPHGLEVEIRLPQTNS